MSLPPESTRGRIVEAATAEFADHGIAGARIDRIARAAKTSKERVYAHFRSKDELYRFIAARELDAVAAATALDPADLPGYAGRLHDYYTANPASRRLMRWGALEAAGDPARDLAVAGEKAAVLRQAQRDGLLDSSWDPLDVLVLVNQLAAAWVDQPGLPPSGSAAYRRFLADRRAVVVGSVERIFPAASGERR